MVATLGRTLPTDESHFREAGSAPTTAIPRHCGATESGNGAWFTPEQDITEQETAPDQPAAATCAASLAIKAIAGLAVATVAMIFISSGSVQAIGEQARVGFNQLDRLSPFELFRLFNVIP